MALEPPSRKGRISHLSGELALRFPRRRGWMGARFRLPLQRLCGFRSAIGGNALARSAITNGPLMDGLRSGFEVVERYHATLVAEDREDDGFSLHRGASR